MALVVARGLLGAGVTSYARLLPLTLGALAHTCLPRLNPSILRDLPVLSTPRRSLYGSRFSSGGVHNPTAVSRRARWCRQPGRTAVVARLVPLPLVPDLLRAVVGSAAVRWPLARRLDPDQTAVLSRLPRQRRARLAGAA